MNWRRLRPGELDHEALWLGVSLATLAGAWLWLRLGLPIPGCAFHQLTGAACPTCGMSRCLRFTLHHDWRAALGINPLAFLSYAAVAIFDVYAVAVLVLRLPRLRFDVVSGGVGRSLRFSARAAILGNWAWLLWTRL